MLTRRFALASVLPAVIAGRAYAADSFQGFVAGIYAEASAQGIRRDVLDAAFAGVTPNQSVIAKDQKQVEFTITWARYRALVINDKRISDGRAAVAQNRPLFGAVESRFGVASSVIAGIWGLDQLRRRDWQLSGRRGIGDPGLGGQARGILPDRADGGVAHPQQWRHHAQATDDRVSTPARWGSRNSCRAAISASRWISTAMDGATSGPARRMYWARSPITWPAPAGGRVRPGGNRLPFRPAASSARCAPPTRRMGATRRHARRR